jgi:hypothetical protein
MLPHINQYTHLQPTNFFSSVFLLLMSPLQKVVGMKHIPGKTVALVYFESSESLEEAFKRDSAICLREGVSLAISRYINRRNSAADAALPPAAASSVQAHPAPSNNFFSFPVLSTTNPSSTPPAFSAAFGVGSGLNSSSQFVASSSGFALASGQSSAFSITSAAPGFWASSIATSSPLVAPFPMTAASVVASSFSDGASVASTYSG